MIHPIIVINKDFTDTTIVMDKMMDRVHTEITEFTMSERDYR